jgi:hypothetical protein
MAAIAWRRGRSRLGVDVLSFAGWVSGDVGVDTLGDGSSSSAIVVTAATKR